MTDSFFERPILNSPYAYPGRHWELDDDRQPTFGTQPLCEQWSAARYADNHTI